MVISAFKRNITTGIFGPTIGTALAAPSGKRLATYGRNVVDNFAGGLITRMFGPPNMKKPPRGPRGTLGAEKENFGPAVTPLLRSTADTVSRKIDVGRGLSVGQRLDKKTLTTNLIDYELTNFSYKPPKFDRRVLTALEKSRQLENRIGELIKRTTKAFKVVDKNYKIINTNILKRSITLDIRVQHVDNRLTRFIDQYNKNEDKRRRAAIAVKRFNDREENRIRALNNREEGLSGYDSVPSLSLAGLAFKKKTSDGLDWKDVFAGAVLGRILPTALAAIGGAALIGLLGLPVFIMGMILKHRLSTKEMDEALEKAIKKGDPIEIERLLNMQKSDQSRTQQNRKKSIDNIGKRMGQAKNRGNMDAHVARMALERLNQQFRQTQDQGERRRLVYEYLELIDGLSLSSAHRRHFSNLYILPKAARDIIERMHARQKRSDYRRKRLDQMLPPQPKRQKKDYPRLPEPIGDKMRRFREWERRSPLEGAARPYKEEDIPLPMIEIPKGMFTQPDFEMDELDGPGKHPPKSLPLWQRQWKRGKGRQRMKMHLGIGPQTLPRSVGDSGLIWDRGPGGDPKGDEAYQKRMHSGPTTMQKARFGVMLNRAKIHDEKSQFLQFGQLPPGFEFISGIKGRLGQQRTGIGQGSSGMMGRGGGYRMGPGSRGPGSMYSGPSKQAFGSITKMGYTPNKGGTVAAGEMGPEGIHRKRVDVPHVLDGVKRRASLRYNNPGAAWPSKTDRLYGIQGYGILKAGGERNEIGKFPTVVHGLAANMALFKRKYTGKTVRAALAMWRNRGGTAIPGGLGLSSNTVITPEMTNSPKWMAQFFHSMARHESGKKDIITTEQYKQASDFVAAGGIEKWKTLNPNFKPTEITVRPPTAAPKAAGGIPFGSSVKGPVGAGLAFPVTGKIGGQPGDRRSYRSGWHSQGALDISAPGGTPIHSPGDGTVLRSYVSGSYAGRSINIEIQGDDGQIYELRNYHMSQFAEGLSPDDIAAARKSGKPLKIKKGQIIGFVGKSGRGGRPLKGGTHLHVETRKVTYDEKGRNRRATIVNPNDAFGFGGKSSRGRKVIAGEQSIDGKRIPTKGPMKLGGPSISQGPLSPEQRLGRHQFRMGQVGKSLGLPEASFGGLLDAKSKKQKMHDSGVFNPNVNIKDDKGKISRRSDKERKGKVKGMVVHYTRGAKTVIANQEYGASKGNGTHYYIDKKGKVFKWADDDQVMVHIKDPSRSQRTEIKSWMTDSNTIGVEVVVDVGDEINEAQSAALHRLVSDKSREHGFDMKGIAAHAELQTDKDDGQAGTDLIRKKGFLPPVKAAVTEADKKLIASRNKNIDPTFGSGWVGSAKELMPWSSDSKYVDARLAKFRKDATFGDDLGRSPADGSGNLGLDLGSMMGHSAGLSVPPPAAPYTGPGMPPGLEIPEGEASAAPDYLSVNLPPDAEAKEDADKSVPEPSLGPGEGRGAGGFRTNNPETEPEGPGSSGYGSFGRCFV